MRLCRRSGFKGAGTCRAPTARRPRAGAENSVRSSDLHILVHEPAEAVASQRSACSAGAWGDRPSRASQLSTGASIRYASRTVLPVVQDDDEAVTPEAASERLFRAALVVAVTP
jgi:hypothetical protein